MIASINKKQIDRRMGGQTEGQTDGGMDRHTDGRMDGRMVSWWVWWLRMGCKKIILWIAKRNQSILYIGLIYIEDHSIQKQNYKLLWYIILCRHFCLIVKMISTISSRPIWQAAKPSIVQH